ncbi:39S ribosomal protein L40, mitochondrial-like [Paramacrobiotus metropolitanus]|uniref:39S ribosomal protein L40, mitochondrial-like n=1 Tax=Paramacrobiotus metropolitanus TaxID=2943436 RepID=UPI0024458037|nr:39S ribosomal protein L40, mitochondrial-like [Paramacrobiotus metropolitanus]
MIIRMNVLRSFLARTFPLSSAWSVRSACPFHTFSPALFWTNPVLCAEPMKKKKRVDPAVLRAREERKKKRIEKTISKLAKNAQKLKPIDEWVVPKQLRLEMKERTRKPPPLEEEELERRALLRKTWTRYKHYQYLAEQDKLSTMVMSAEAALRELRIESEELYQKAVQLDNMSLPITLKGPVNTPPIPGYISPDGDYLNTTRKW